MKHTLLLIALLGTFSGICQTQNYYNTTAGNGYGFRFWNGSDSYKIHMGNASEYKYGGVTDYSIKMNMNSTSGRGWVWGVAGQTPIASLNNQGDLHIQGEFYANNGWLRVKGSGGIFFQDYGGGFRMQDNTWIRTYGNKSFYHNTGIMRTDGRFEVGPSGNRFTVGTNGRVGVGITNPAEEID
ncbi:MAG: shufflon system plasmid conjugative transfer pilus tip adhesin PilV, partial [Bacteroidota bacterium]